VLCAIGRVAEAHLLPPSAVGDWLAREGAATGQVDPATVPAQKVTGRAEDGKIKIVLEGNIPVDSPLIDIVPDPHVTITLTLSAAWTAASSPSRSTPTPTWTPACWAISSADSRARPLVPSSD
jgi:hypothetical protein